jgi:hypothetical protein
LEKAQDVLAAAAAAAAGGGYAYASQLQQKVGQLKALLQQYNIVQQAAKHLVQSGNAASSTGTRTAAAAVPLGVRSDTADGVMGASGGLPSHERYTAAAQLKWLKDQIVRAQRECEGLMPAA